MTREQKGYNGPTGHQRPPHPWLEGRNVEEPRWPDDWLFRLHLFAGLSALAVVLFLVFGRRLFRNRCMSCSLTDKVKIWWMLNIRDGSFEWSSSKTSVDIMFQCFIAVYKWSYPKIFKLFFVFGNTSCSKMFFYKCEWSMGYKYAIALQLLWVLQ